MKQIFACAAAFLCVVAFGCGSEKTSNPSQHSSTSQLDRQVFGTWRYGLVWNKDTTFNMVMSYDSLHDYRINVNINGTDTMEKERGSWAVAVDTLAKNDTVWMDRMSCRQINTATRTLDSVDCGIGRAGIRLNIDANGAWDIPLNDFAVFLPPGIVPAGIALPLAAFVKDPS